MNSQQRTVLKLSATPVEKPWGGNKLQRYLTESDAFHGNLGEIWLVSTVGDEESHSKILSGPYAGKSLSQLIRNNPEMVLGSEFGSVASPVSFPLLFKWIDARSDLSVQVHPGDDLAKSLGLGETGKEETWLILDAEPGATVMAGYSAGWDMERLLGAISSGKEISAALERIPVASGDLVHIPPGTVHSIGGGILLAEIQQPSDVTFRIHDGDTVGTDGRPRELHLDQASKVSSEEAPTWIQADPTDTDSWRTRLSVEPYQIMELQGSWSGNLPAPKDRCSIFCTLDGEARLHGCEGPEGTVKSAEVRLILPGEGEITMETVEEGWFAIFAPSLRPR